VKPAPKPRLLVVDDDLPVQRAVWRLFRAKGYVVFVAQDGVEALDVVGKSRPDVILLDISMPRLDGLQVLEELRGLPSSPPVLVITAQEGGALAEKAAALGAAGLIAKPFDLECLESAVERLLSSRTASPETGRDA